MTLNQWFDFNKSVNGQNYDECTVYFQNGSPINFIYGESDPVYDAEIISVTPVNNCVCNIVIGIYDENERRDFATLSDVCESYGVIQDDDENYKVIIRQPESTHIIPCELCISPDVLDRHCFSVWYCDTFRYFSF